MKEYTNKNGKKVSLAYIKRLAETGNLLTEEVKSGILLRDKKTNKLVYEFRRID